jgi:Tol biopolymer transport system component
VPTWGSAAFSVSEDGTLIYQRPGRWDRQLVWFDRAGTQIGTLGEPAEYVEDPRFSPDGRYAAIARMDPEARERDLWVLDAARGIASRLTSDPGLERFPVWSPDGTRLAFMATRGGPANLYVKLANGSGSEELLLESDLWKFPLDWSPDGKSLLYGAVDPKNRTDIWVLPLSGDRKPWPLLNSPFAENDSRFSPDGKWIAYSSYETGRQEVFVQPFPPTGPKWQVSVGGGNSPRWRRDGKEIFYFQPESSRMAVEIRTDRGFEAGVPRKLFETPLGTGSDVTGDGQRFLINMPHGENPVTPATVVLNWTAAGKR